jgi:hypothetical protein
MLSMFPEGVRGIIYAYLRHPCADLLQAPLFLRYVYRHKLTYDDLLPSRTGESYGRIQRTGISRGEQIRLRRRVYNPQSDAR